MQVIMEIEEYNFLKEQDERLNELRRLASKCKEHGTDDFINDKYIVDKITIDKSVIKDILMKINNRHIEEETEIIIKEN